MNGRVDREYPATHTGRAADAQGQAAGKIRPGMSRRSTALLALAALMALPGRADAASIAGEALSPAWGIPFAGMLLSIALLPLVAGRIWHHHYGKITAHTISGDVTASGEIMKFGADTVSGNVFVDATGTPDEIRANTVSGDVTVRLAPEVPAQYTISTVSGRLQVDNSDIRGVHGQYKAKFGDLDKKWLEFRANTVSGNVSVVHAVSA